MPTWKRQACQRQTSSAWAIASLVLLEGLLLFCVIYLTLSWKDVVGEDLTPDLNDTYDDCRSKVMVVTDKALTQTLDTRTNFSQAWINAEQKAEEPAHDYMEKHHSVAIHMYTNMLQTVEQDFGITERTGKQLKETFESRSLYLSLSEAVQILKHNQVTCLHTNYRTQTLLNLSISDKLIRFSTFILGSDEWSSTRNASCFEVHTCFGADITHYSALKQNHQVLVPPYEVFKVTDIETDAQKCKVIYKLKSNLNCVYDKESNTLHSISASPVEAFWLYFVVICMIIVSILLPFIVVKVLEN